MYILNNTKKNTFHKLTLRLFKFLKVPYFLLILLSVLLMAIDIFFNVSLAWIERVFLDTINLKNLQRLTFYTNLTLLSIFFVFVISIFNYFIKSIVLQLIVRDISRELFNKINKINFQSMIQWHWGDLISRMSLDIGKASQIINNIFYDLTSSLLLFIFAFFYLSNINFYLALLTISLGPLLFLITSGFNKVIRNYSKKIQEKEANIRVLTSEVFQGMDIVKSFNMEEDILFKFLTERTSLNKLISKRAFTISLMWQIVAILTSSLIIFSTYLIALNTISGLQSVGSILTFIVLALKIQSPIQDLVNTRGNIQENLGSAERIFDVYDIANDNNSKIKSEYQSNKYSINNENNIAISFKNVYFNINNNEILTNINLDIIRGSTTAIIGQSGSGKTTLARLCCGLYECKAGEIQIYGNPIRKEDIDSSISYVPQVPFLFNGTIYENITLGFDDITFEKVVSAAKQANIHNFISGLKFQYETIIGENGVSLSGGQRQRIAISRALLRDKPILIMDEGTSAQDMEGENMILNSLKNFRKECTTIIITHRLSTIKSADSILVMKDGQIIEQGNHQNLYDKKGLYYDMCENELISKA